ncbi:MAG: DNA translocase FtsK [Deltaproteobacteria bacterium]|nr:DNA translocase FtsK [Deltaproteobacteria bacterium]
MRKEIAGICLFFMVIFSLMSLLSYSAADPSFFNPKAMQKIQNLFGLLGSYSAGTLIGLFGLGAFWIPILLLFLSIHFFCNQPAKKLVSTIAGGILLVLATGSLMALHKPSYVLLGTRFPAGGLIGLPAKSILIQYTNIIGSSVILILLWMIGFILVTGFSLINLFNRSWKMGNYLKERIVTLFFKWNERRKKTRKLARFRQEQALKKKRKIKIKKPPPGSVKTAPVPKQDVFEFMNVDSGFKMPSFNLLDAPERKPAAADEQNLRMQSRLLEKKLSDFGVSGEVVAVTPGPVVTTFEYEPAAGVKINKIINLTDDLALTLRAASIRVVAPIPGKAVIGIEIPNLVRETVRFKEIVSSGAFEKSKSKLTICLGKDIVGNPVVTDLDKMPHLLIAGATGSGKSVALNAMICSLLYKSIPDDVRLIIIDPKRIELSIYDGIPHLITPVVTDAKKATHALFWAVKEMEQRYELLSERQARNIYQYNTKVAKESSDDGKRLPYIVIVIDELADLMMLASRDVEIALTRLAQMARAAGIHLILATQRPSVDVLTGVIKANFPTRLSFQVSSKTDSRTILDTNGAENLLGNGDMLFLPPGTAKIQRIHGAYISEAELTRITNFLKTQKKPEYDPSVTKHPVEDEKAADTDGFDERYDEAVALVTRTGQASISMIQRHLRIGYNRAARIIEVMEKQGIVGPSDGVKPREVLVTGYDKMP